jgi:uncharacterized protein YcbX
MPVGRVLELHRWPVKSMAGETLRQLELFEHGVPNDRRWAVTWRDGQLLTARVSPRLLAWTARVNGDGVVLTDPDGREWRWGEPLRERLAQDLGKDVALHEDEALNQDLHDSVLVTFEASLDAIGQDLRRFRTNIHVEADAEPFAEARWEGMRLRIGEATFQLLHPCKRCVIVTRDPDTQHAHPEVLKHLHAHHDSIFGINARPLNRATIHAGDRVEVLPAQTG